MKVPAGLYGVCFCQRNVHTVSLQIWHISINFLLCFLPVIALLSYLDEGMFYRSLAS